MTENTWVFVAGLIVFSCVFTWASLALALWLTARASGWTELATQYGRAFPESSTPRLLKKFGIGKERPLWYNNAIRARIQNRTLHLRPTIIAKIAHKPMAVSLGDLEFEADSSNSKSVQIAVLKTFPNRKIWFTREDAAWIKAAQGPV